MTFSPGDSFMTLDDGWYRPTKHSRGPWDPDACHAGPPAAAIARELEALVPQASLTRLSVDLLRPVPWAGFRIESETLHGGRTVANTSAELLDGDGRVCARARGLHITPKDQGALPTVPVEHPGGPFGDAQPGPFPIGTTAHGLPGFNTAVEVRYPPGETNEPGPTTLWMRTVPLLPDETPSPFQQICALSDSGNAISRNGEPWDVNFVNPDLTIVLHREPVGEWMGSQVSSQWHPNGIGLADALLFDSEGVVGRATQTLVLRATSTQP
jgi:hypothetical protein